MRPAWALKTFITNFDRKVAKEQYTNHTRLEFFLSFDKYFREESKEQRVRNADSYTSYNNIVLKAVKNLSLQ